MIDDRTRKETTTGIVAGNATMDPIHPMATSRHEMNVTWPNERQFLAMVNSYNRFTFDLSQYTEPGADPGFVERGGGAAATASASGAKVFGGSRLKTLFGISKGGRAPCAPPP